MTAIAEATSSYFPALQKPYISKIPDPQWHPKKTGFYMSVSCK